MSMDQRALTWAIFFLAATLRVKKEPSVSTVEADADRADQMMKLYDKRFSPTYGGK